MQTNYSMKQAEGFPGMIADQGERHVETHVGEGAGLSFGLFLVQGSSDRQAKLPSAAADVVIGALAASHAHSTEADLEGRQLDILKGGRIWVRVETAVAKHDSGHVRYAGAGNAGELRNSAVANETLPVPGKFMTSAAAGELAIFEVAL